MAKFKYSLTLEEFMERVAAKLGSNAKEVEQQAKKLPGGRPAVIQGLLNKIGKK